MRRIKAIYLEPAGPMTPWGQAVMAAVGERHDLTVYDHSRPIAQQFADVEVIIDLGGGQATRQILEAAKHVKLWQMITVGYDKVDLSYARQAGIPVAHCPGATSATGLAEAAIMFMLMLVKKYHQAQDHLKQGRLHELALDDLEGRILGLIGFGASGQALGGRAWAMGMRLMIIEPLPIDHALLDQIQPLFVGQPDAIDKVMAESDFVSLHLPLTPRTRGLIDARRISLMKPTAGFINVARGALVDEAALYQALRDGRIAGIGTDVFFDDDLEPAQSLLTHPNFVALPHISGTCTSSFKRRAAVAAENVDRVAQGLEPKYRVDLLLG